MRFGCLCLLAACSYDYDSVKPPVGQFVVTPTIAGVNDTLVIDGRFTEDTSVLL